MIVFPKSHPEFHLIHLHQLFPVKPTEFKCHPCLVLLTFRLRHRHVWVRRTDSRKVLSPGSEVSWFCWYPYHSMLLTARRDRRTERDWGRNSPRLPERPTPQLCLVAPPSAPRTRFLESRGLLAGTDLAAAVAVAASVHSPYLQTNSSLFRSQSSCPPYCCTATNPGMPYLPGLLPLEVPGRLLALRFLWSPGMARRSLCQPRQPNPLPNDQAAALQQRQPILRTSPSDAQSAISEYGNGWRGTGCCGWKP
jgi:hypothetical protein